MENEFSCWFNSRALTTLFVSKQKRKMKGNLKFWNLQPFVKLFPRKKFHNTNSLSYFEAKERFHLFVTFFLRFINNHSSVMRGFGIHSGLVSCVNFQKSKNTRLICRMHAAKSIRLIILDFGKFTQLIDPVCTQTHKQNRNMLWQIQYTLTMLI